MDPVTLAGPLIAALVQYVGRKGARLARRAGRDLDGAVDGHLDRIYDIVARRVAGDRMAERTLQGFEANPTDARQQGRLELTLEGYLEQDPSFASQLATLLDQLANRQPSGGTVIRDAGAVSLHGNVNQKGTYVAGRDLTIPHDR